MDRELTILEYEVIPGLDRYRATLENVLTMLTRQTHENENVFALGARRIDAAARAAVSVPDSAIAARVLSGNGVGGGAAAALSRMGGDYKVLWGQITAALQDRHRQVSDELHRSTRRLEMLREQERARRRRGGAT